MTISWFRQTLDNIEIDNLHRNPFEVFQLVKRMSGFVLLTIVVVLACAAFRIPIAIIGIFVSVLSLGQLAELAFGLNDVVTVKWLFGLLVGISLIASVVVFSLGKRSEPANARDPFQ